MWDRAKQDPRPTPSAIPQQKKDPSAEQRFPLAGPSDTRLHGQARLDTQSLRAHVITDSGSFSSELFFDFVGMVLPALGAPRPRCSTT